MKKLIFALIVIAALLVVVMPAAAQGPNPLAPYWYDRTPEQSQVKTWNDAGGDPFGGYPRLGVDVKYVPDGKGGVMAFSGSGALATKAVPTWLGVKTWTMSNVPYGPQSILPGGIPSSASGDGLNARKAIFIGGAWADDTVDPRGNLKWDPNTNADPRIAPRYQAETPYEIPACATVKIPAGTSKWFKLDTWKVNNLNNRIRTQIWLDDELDGATKFSGSANFGAANKFFLGTANYGDGWSVNYYSRRNQQDTNLINGYLMNVYDPDVLQPNYAYPAPNAFILTVDTGKGASRGCTAAVYAGQSCVKASSGGPALDSTDWGTLDSTAWYNTRLDEFGNGVTAILGAVKGMGRFNPSQPSHLLWYEGNWDGWVYVEAYNQMIWDGTATVCSYRNSAGQ